MCKAHVLRFRCSHGVLMGFELCRTGVPCPVLKLTGNGLPQQPYRCYNCQHKAQQAAERPPSSRQSSATSSVESFESGDSFSSSSPPTPSPVRAATWHPLPGVAVQPKGCVKISRPTSGRSFTFACHSSDHFITPHYAELPTFLPHRDHPCPPCQLEELRARGDAEVTRSAVAEYPNLREEMLVSDGRTFDPEIMSKPTMEKYVEEKRTEEREMWLHVTRKWTQDLKRVRVLVAEEDGLGLLG